MASGILLFILVNVKGLISAGRAISAGEFPNEPPEVACKVLAPYRARNEALRPKFIARYGVESKLPANTSERWGQSRIKTIELQLSDL